MDKTKRKKIYYIPGIISLTILPILFWSYNEHYQKTLNQTVIRLLLWDPDLPKKYPNIFTAEYPPKRKYQDIYLTGDNESDRIKLDFSQIRVREILKQNDSVNGVHYHFGKKSEYWTFIKALDIFQIEQAKTYMVYEDDIWFIHYPPDTTMQNFVCGTLYHDVVSFQPKISLWTKTIRFAKPIWDSSWLLIVGFAFFSFFMIRHILRRQRNSR